MNKIAFLEAEDLKEMMGIALRSVYMLMKQPDFPVIKVSARRYIVPESAFREWLDMKIKEKSGQAWKRMERPDGREKYQKVNTCEQCRREFIADYPGRTKYCPECGVQIRAQQNRDRVRRYRERMKKQGDE